MQKKLCTVFHRFRQSLIVPTMLLLGSCTGYPLLQEKDASGMRSPQACPGILGCINVAAIDEYYGMQVRKLLIQRLRTFPCNTKCISPLLLKIYLSNKRTALGRYRSGLNQRVAITVAATYTLSWKEQVLLEGIAHEKGSIAFQGDSFFSNTVAEEDVQSNTAKSLVETILIELAMQEASIWEKIVAHTKSINPPTRKIEPNLNENTAHR